MVKPYDKQFKLATVQYYSEHKNLGLKGCAKNLGVSYQTLSRWKKELRESRIIHPRGSGNYSSDLAKENAHLKRQLLNTEDALDVLKKNINILGN
ncbi:transposase [Enterococcus sp. BWB1-3]|uniref:transposase n=1 Tax=Enterococcus sp. BWB1-3 TaxID=2787713 RepID=UPI001920E528|nr:transposase [Enterococcus sp. BWB1-3]MBL1230954.1 transposase [Enterococcus sp. BWB1-3]